MSQRGKKCLAVALIVGVVLTLLFWVTGGGRFDIPVNCQCQEQRK